MHFGCEYAHAIQNRIPQNRKLYVKSIDLFFVFLNFSNNIINKSIVKRIIFHFKVFYFILHERIHNQNAYIIRCIFLEVEKR